MDSGNSGSIQSSSGGDEDYDSRAESISPFLNIPSTPYSTNISYPPSPPTHHHPSDTMFNPTTITVPIPAVTENKTPSLVVPSSPSPSLLTDQIQNQAHAHHALPERSNHNPPKKKRSRASRRAPTTVLTTNTTNFRAMVQEFTGIPAQPFASSPFATKTSFDLFGAPSRIRSSTLYPPQPPSNILRPFAQKFQPTQSITTNNYTSATSGLNVISTIQNSRNQILPFPSLVESAPVPPLTNKGLFEIPSNDFVEFGLQNLISSDQAHLRSVDGDHYEFPQSVTSGKHLNYSASSPSQNVPARGERMVESWMLCTSE